MTNFDFYPYSQISVGPLHSGAFEAALTEFQGRKIVILVDENTHDCCLDYLLTQFEALKNAEVIVIPAGEDNKVMEICMQVWKALTDYHISRTDLLINLGGGVVCDMGGFIASLFKRGLTFMHIPTSLLAMVDAAIGGKNGVDLEGLKNQLGTFNHPSHIFVDPAFLSSLPEKELWNGHAETLKHGMISSISYFETLLQIDTTDKLIEASDIVESIRVKSQIVTEDPSEKNIRKILNFGHTFGHALETYFLTRSPIDHGHAVALGILVETFLSKQLLSFPENAFLKTIQHISKLFEVLCPPREEWDEIWESMLQDKKNDRGTVRPVLLKNIGEATLNTSIDYEQFKSGMTFLDVLAHPK
jgi:3-dehydroquinate synthase